MRVCIDMQAAVTQRAGIGRYATELVPRLAVQAADSLSLFYFDFLRQAAAPHAPNAEIRTARWCPGRVVEKAWLMFGWPPFNFFSGQADVFHFPNFLLPPLSRGRSVVTIHDTAFLRMPETVETRNLHFLRTRIAETIRRADAIIAVSDFTASEIKELLHADPAKVHAIHSGISPDFRAPPDDVIATISRRRGLDRPYILTVGTLEPRKNIPFLIDVFEKMPDFDGLLVIAGSPGWKYGPILDRIKTSTRATDIRHVEHLSDDELRAVYAGADLFMFPSLYEGFGFPPLEAMACGTPVLASAGGALREVLGDGAVIMEEYDAESWAARAVGALRNAELAEAGRRLVSRYTWEETARKTWQVYETVAKLGG